MNTHTHTSNCQKVNCPEHPETNIRLAKAIFGSASVADNTPEPRNETRVDFKWSNRNFADGWWKTFYYCQGQGFNAGHKVYYGRNDWRTEADAIAAQERWERIRATSD